MPGEKVRRDVSESLGMAHAEDKRYVELCQDSVRLTAESVGMEITDEVAALIAEDVCYRLRELTQFSAQALRHSRRRRLTVEDLNRALNWSNVDAICGHGSPDAVSFRSIRDGECHCAEDRDINLVELALATNIPKGTAETSVRVHVSYLDGKGNLEPQGTVPAAVSVLTDDLLKYYQRVTRAVLGDDLQLMKVALQDLQTNAKIAALLPYFVYVVSGVKSVSHDLGQLSRLLQLVRSLLWNPYLSLGYYGYSLMQSVLYCVTEPLAASINPLNDHWTLRDYGAGLLSVVRTHKDLAGALYPQILQSLQKVLGDPVRPLCSHYGAVVGLNALGWQAVEQVLYPLLPTYWSGLQTVLDDHSMSNAQVKADGHKVYGAILVAVERLIKMKACSSDPDLHNTSLPPPHQSLGSSLSVPLLEMYSELYCFFGDSLAVRFGTGGTPSHQRKALKGPQEPKKDGPVESTRKMPQLIAHGEDDVGSAGRPSQRLSQISLTSTRPRESSCQRQRSQGVREAFQRSRLTPCGTPHFTFLIGGRQAGKGCGGRRFQSVFQLHTGPGVTASRYAQKLPMIGRVARQGYKGTQGELSLYLPL
ncbi:TAF6-like RNA polymerase II p300/CBP-associated factor-associated factor 65 kDa subunit 6L [Spea bombifrons]|uniref:TAF6-like RNA polymerase II p300/CBP-associated factor-associated factor 65 kDa subunit 6L n=1 Tax=Spea bombifrons TaxID=233779 RepID=UPI00234967E9|nr:TAF6-like RNA polymerase II p300/CBP-associated factor-associated factor 65 kDa subunit 6L [Spea bombifrons]